MKRRKFNFWGIPKNEGGVIASLYEVFRSIELVSIILRFIRPENYGIISPPVERVLDVKRGSDAVETYLNYLEDLRKIKRYYSFARVSDADMALCVVHEKCYGEPKDPEVQEHYRSDRFLLRLRTKNLLGHFFEQYSYTELAGVLASLKPQLAAQIGGLAFERMVRERVCRANDENLADKDLNILIDELHDRGVIDSLTRGQWHKARKVRNKAIHSLALPTNNEVASLLKLLE